MENKENNKDNFFKRKWHWFIFGLLALVSLSFLIFQRGVWLFSDARFYSDSLRHAKIVAFSKLGQFATTDGFYLGFDNSTSSFSHLLVDFYQFILTSVFGADIGQIFYYFIYYLVCFYFGFALFKKLFPNVNKKSIGLGALFIAFNPVSILLVTLFAVGYIYAAFIAFLYFFLNYLEKGRWVNLLFSVLFAVYLLSYLRLVPIIVFSFLLVVWLFNDRINFNFRRFTIFLFVIILCASPFIVSNIQSLSGSENIVNNYKDFFSKYNQANYDFKGLLVNTFSHPGNFSFSAFSFFYNHMGVPGFSDNFAVKNSFEFFQLTQILFNGAILLLALFHLRDKRSLKIISAICFIFFINGLAHFVSFDIFNKINKTVLVFLYNDYGFLQFTQSILFAILLVILTDRLISKLTRQKKYFVFGIVIAYLLVNLFPVFSGHDGFKKVDDIPDSYSEVFFTNQDYDFAEATIFAPYYWLKFEWSPYFLNFNIAGHSKYKSPVVPDLKIINKDLSDFYNDIYGNFDQPGLPNLAILNIKNIFIFHDVSDANDNIDSYGVENIENASLLMNRDLQLRSDLVLAKNYQNFTFYRFNDADRYDFFIYSPKNIINLNVNNFYKASLNLSDKPLIFNESGLNEINLLDKNIWQENSPTVEIKASVDNANKYYVRLSGFDKSKPFLLQFNQMFSTSWRVYFSNQEEWDEVQCKSSWQSFEVTENSRCRYSGSAFDHRDLNFIGRKYLKEENHFTGNLVANTFLFTPRDLPTQYQDGNDLYLVIYFQKQLYYIITLSISAVTFLILIFLSIVSLLRFKKKHVKKK